MKTSKIEVNDLGDGEGYKIVVYDPSDSDSVLFAKRVGNVQVRPGRTVTIEGKLTIDNSNYKDKMPVIDFKNNSRISDEPGNPNETLVIR